MGWNRLVEEKIAVYISKSLHDEVKSRIKKSGGQFKSVEGYVEVVLREFFTKRGGEKAYTKEVEELIKNRLRRLGYL